MIALTKVPFAEKATHDEFLKNVADLHQVKALSRWLGLSASLQSSTSGEAQFLKRWAAVENSHADLLSNDAGRFGSESEVELQSPLRLAQNILQQDSGSALSSLFFHSLIGLKQWEIEHAEQLQLQASSHSELDLLKSLKKVQRGDLTMAKELIVFCNQRDKHLSNSKTQRSLEIA